MQEKQTQKQCPTSSFFAEVFRVRRSAQPDLAKDSEIREELSSLNWPVWLKPGSLRICCLKMYPACYLMTEGGHLRQSSTRWTDWGMVWNGNVLTAKISAFPSQETACTLSDILMSDFNGDLMQYYHEDDSVRQKVVSAVPSVEIHGNKLCGCLNVELRESLNEGEQAVLCDYISGQYSDGWGEGFEQRDIRVEEGTLAVHFWQEDGFKMTPTFEKTQEQVQMTQRPKMKLLGEDGNIFAIMGRASLLLKNAGQSDKAKEMCNRVMSCDSYHKALNVISEYVETELTPKTRNKPNRGDAR